MALRLRSRAAAARRGRGRRRLVHRDGGGWSPAAAFIVYCDKPIPAAPRPRSRADRAGQAGAHLLPPAREGGQEEGRRRADEGLPELRPPEPGRPRTSASAASTCAGSRRGSCRRSRPRPPRPPRRPRRPRRRRPAAPRAAAPAGRGAPPQPAAPRSRRPAAAAAAPRRHRPRRPLAGRRRDRGPRRRTRAAAARRRRPRCRRSRRDAARARRGGRAGRGGRSACDPGGRARVWRWCATRAASSTTTSSTSRAARGVVHDPARPVYLVPFGTGGAYEQEVEIRSTRRAPPRPRRGCGTSRSSRAPATAAAAAAPLVLGIQPYEEFETAVKPERASGPPQGELRRGGRNKANAPVEVALAHQIPRTRCRVEFAPPSPSPAGRDKATKLAVRPPQADLARPPGRAPVRGDIKPRRPARRARPRGRGRGARGRRRAAAAARRAGCATRRARTAGQSRTCASARAA